MAHKANLYKIGALATVVPQIKWVMKTSEYIYISIFIFRQYEYDGPLILFAQYRSIFS